MEQQLPIPEPIFVQPKIAAKILNCGMTKLWELVRQGRLDARRMGRRTPITMASIRRYADSLPPAREAA
ncbi:helix-turn-helix domain-containing protein [Falsiroseomonas tokyonensis]|uniref:Helix-turn-helix domain-containing protein n=1 Tax=Falsiroseomonas tokyonensis TaxID=430521 RepID=A0ABV7C020_9PROT|nr:helix-turn-helix domain-containing protein [Falsiroseomonas tokyonensis]MBU8540003.1 helix-turn-helix domain-containing protein [Falsiroseomonas tokyonensis]